nr:cupin domain-containing protein [Acuticoccus mangrovi]
MSAGGRLALGAMEIGPGEALPWHHHAAEEIYHVITGTGRLTVDGEVHQLKPGTTAFIPADAWHLTEAHRRGRLRVLFFFPDRPLREVDYHFDPTDRLAA